jgi:hypothetical protein
MPTLQYTVNVQMKTETCCTCGVVFGMPADLQEQFRERKNSFYCPNGHSQHYTAENLTEQLQQARVELAKAQNSAAFWRNDADYKAAELAKKAAELEKTKKAAANAAKRTAAGVCPCCHRTIKQLARHIETKHPGYKPK